MFINIQPISSQQNYILGTPVNVDGFWPVLGCGCHVKKTGIMSSTIEKLGEDDDG